MTVKLLTEKRLESLSFKGCHTGSSESIQCQNARLLEISCCGSFREFIMAREDGCKDGYFIFI